MDVINLDEYRQTHPAGTPREISFYGTAYRDADGNEKTLTFNVRVENGDAVGILEAVIENGGIGRYGDEGTFYYLPWPCAAVEIRDV